MIRLAWSAVGAGALVLAAMVAGGCGGASASPHDAPTVASGPWGELVATPVVIAPTPDVLATIDSPTEPPSWVFREIEETELADLLAAATLSDADYERLLATLHPLEEGAGYVLEPDEAVLRSLSPVGRATLYHRLAQDPLNRAMMNAFRFAGPDPARWLGGWGLSPETRSRVEPLIYRNGGVQFFADSGVVFPAIDDPAERLRLLQALAAEQTLQLTLRVPPGADPDALAAYWDYPGRPTSLRALFASLAARPEGGEIDVVHLLPPFARARLYHYPRQSALLPGGDSRDCHWTALNFFAPGEPDDRYARASEVTAALGEAYEPVADQPRFGDLVVFSSGGEHYHSAVYIAADILFTRNGTRFSRPWMFTRLADMRDFYPRLDPIEVRYLRPRSTAE